MKIVSGSTTPGATNWINYGNDGIYVDIDTTSAGFSTTPVYLTTIGGTNNHWTTKGASSIYNAKTKGFRVYINKTGVTPDYANQRQWHINWTGIGK